MSANIKYGVNVPHVQEVSLFGAADADFWREQLKPEGLALRADAMHAKSETVRAR
jgi:hypothetical protein